MSDKNVVLIPPKPVEPNLLLIAVTLLMILGPPAIVVYSVKKYCKK